MILQRQERPKSIRNACKNEAAIKTVLIAASLFGAQGRSGGPLGRPGPPFPARAAPRWTLAKTSVKPYDSAVCAGGLLGARPPGAELLGNGGETLNSAENNKNQET